ncbi:MAG: DUF1540 domain-containing protein [Peptococcaceae bacterium]|nr:DUF1540 domain-containing protein [Peptococcaceae bacterium]
MPERTSNPIHRVKCVVERCKYWQNGINCVATTIEVQGLHANSVQSTDCATFENHTHRNYRRRKPAF